MTHWILDGHTPVKVDLMTWAKWFENYENRRVALTKTKHHRISTVFLGLDHQWGKGPPLIFETMAFKLDSSSGEDLDMARYSTWDDAEAGHRAMVRRFEKLEQDS